MNDGPLLELPPVIFARNESTNAARETSLQKPETGSPRPETNVPSNASGIVRPETGDRISASATNPVAPTTQEQMPNGGARKFSEHLPAPVVLPTGETAGRAAGPSAAPISLPGAAGPQPAGRELATPLNMPLAAPGPAGTPKNDRSPIALKLPAEAHASNSQPIGSPHLPATGTGIADGKPATASLKLWGNISERTQTGDKNARPPELPLGLSGGNRNPGSREPSSALALDVAHGTNTPPPAPGAQPLLVEPMLDHGGSVTNWRDEQIARQTAQQKERERQRSRLKHILYDWLMLSDSGRDN